MTKPHIQEVIVVEGRHDTEKLKKYFDCDTIETGGTSLGKEVLNLIERAQKERGVIVFTDPDGPGNRIRHVVNQTVPGCKNAFIDRRNAHTDKKVGVEHADYPPLYAALANCMTYSDHPQKKITMQDLYELGLTGRQNSAEKRRFVGEHYHIGDGNGRTMLNRLNCLGIDREELKETVQEWKD